MNISFLTSGHEPFDDRIFYHMARSLSDHNENVEIVSSKCDLTDLIDGIRLNCFAGETLSKRDKIEHFIDRLSDFKSDLIICSEPITLLASKKYSKKQNRKIRIVYDITEWYPSKKNLAGCDRTYRWLHFLKLSIFNIWVTQFADSFIFGEWFKSRPYRFLYPGKSFIFTPYYPDLKYIYYSNPGLIQGRIRLSFSGKISVEKGYINFLNVIKDLNEQNKDLKIEVKIIGWYESLLDKQECEKHVYSDNPNISLKILEKQDFKSYTETINKTDIFIDLRSDDFENQHCLPIKLFYYAALGRPVIISELKAIRQDVEIEKFGYMVKPGDSESIAKIISNYLNNEDLYYQHCRNARMLAETKYNWQNIEPHFIKFLSL